MPENDAQQPAQGQETSTQEPAAQPAPVDWEAEAKKWEKRSKDNFARLKEAEPKLAEYEQLKAASQTDAERQAQELNRWQSEAETWRKAAVGNRIQALAAVDFADPSDAVAALAEHNFLDAGGQIDEDAIRSELAAVLERKPHWRRPSEGAAAPVTRTPAPSAAQGTGGTPPNDPAAQLAAIVQGQLQRS